MIHKNEIHNQNVELAQLTRFGNSSGYMTLSNETIQSLISKQTQPDPIELANAIKKLETKEIVKQEWQMSNHILVIYFLITIIICAKLFGYKSHRNQNSN